MCLTLKPSALTASPAPHVGAVFFRLVPTILAVHAAAALSHPRITAAVSPPFMGYHADDI